MTAVDLFCGGGGMSAGLLLAGWDVRLGVDWWEPALGVYRANLGHEGRKMDLSDVSGSVAAISRIAPTLIAASPPCQDFSSAGKRAEGERASLTESWARIVAGVLPPFLLMENVPLARKSRSWGVAEGILRESGYVLWGRVLDASYCGVPQRRKRFFVFGWRESDGRGLVGGRMDAWIAAHQAERPLTVRQYLNGEGDRFPPHYYRQSHHMKLRQARSVYSLDEPAPAVVGKNDAPCPAATSGDWPDHYYEKRPRYGRQQVFSLDETAPTLTGNSREVPSAPEDGGEDVGMPDAYYREPLHHGRRSVFTADEPSPTIRSNNAPAPAPPEVDVPDDAVSDHYYDIPRSYVRRAVFSPDELAPTIRGQNPNMPKSYRRHPKDVVPPHQTKRLTPYQRARIQTFPADWDWSSIKARTKLEQVIGNAVPVEMARFIGSAALNAICQGDVCCLHGDGGRRSGC